MRRRSSSTVFLLIAGSSPALAAAPFSCAGAAMVSGTQLICSHTDPSAPTQICNFSWTLSGTAGAPNIVQGSFLLTPGQTNLTVYQGMGTPYELSPPVVLCQGRKS